MGDYGTRVFCTAWSKNEGRFEFHGHENQKFKKTLKKSCNMLFQADLHLFSYLDFNITEKLRGGIFFIRNQPHGG